MSEGERVGHTPLEIADGDSSNVPVTAMWLLPGFRAFRNSEA